MTIRYNKVSLLGIPWDRHSSHMRGAALGPARIHDLMFGGTTNLCAENGVCLEPGRNMTDMIMVSGLDLPDSEADQDVISDAVKKTLENATLPIAIGGDHAISYPVMRAVSAYFGPPLIVHVDAHPDLYHEYDGDRYSHACPFARILESDLASGLMQIGIRTLNDHQRAQAKKYGVNILRREEWVDGACAAIGQKKGNIYLSIDLDGFDPAYAPGVAHPEPGGLSTNDVLRVIGAMRGRLIGADIVEYVPDRDQSDITGMLAVKLIKEIAGHMLAP